MKPDPKILIVDDDDAVRMMLGEYLRLQGYLRIEMARTAEEALQKIQENSPSLVLMDIVMPGIGGAEALKEIRKLERQLNREIPVIMMTGFTHEAVAQSLLHDGAFDYVEKPFNLSHLKEAVRAATAFA